MVMCSAVFSYMHITVMGAVGEHTTVLYGLFHFECHSYDEIMAQLVTK